MRRFSVSRPVHKTDLKTSFLFRRSQSTKIQTVTDNQTFDCTIFVWQCYLCIVMSCASFGLRHSPYSYFNCHAPYIVAVATTFICWIKKTPVSLLMMKYILYSFCYVEMHNNNFKMNIYIITNNIFIHYNSIYRIVL